MKYTDEELKKIQQISLEMAKYFVEFCKKYNLTTYLCGGGAIGTLRHGGFIPWDDDLDFFMPRKDYEKLKRLWNKKASKKYRLNVPCKKYITGDLFINIRDTDTTFIKEYQLGLPVTHGVSLDVLPLDGYPDRPFDRKKQVFWAYIYSLFAAQRVPSNHGKLKAGVCKFLLLIMPGKNLRYRILKTAEREMKKYDIDSCSYITELCSGPYYMTKKYKKEWFDTAKFESFEDTQMPIPVGADGYLREAFGDYMVLPPKEKQVAHHDFYYMDLERGYEN